MLVIHIRKDKQRNTKTTLLPSLCPNICVLERIVSDSVTRFLTVYKLIETAKLLVEVVNFFGACKILVWLSYLLLIAYTTVTPLLYFFAEHMSCPR